MYWVLLQSPTGLWRNCVLDVIHADFIIIIIDASQEKFVVPQNMRLVQFPPPPHPHLHNILIWDSNKASSFIFDNDFLLWWVWVFPRTATTNKN